MLKFVRIAVSVGALALALILPAGASAQAPEPDDEPPLAFAPNAGQADEAVRYVAQGAGYSFLFTDDSAVLSLLRADERDADDAEAVGGVALALRFVGANPDARLEAREPASGTVNDLTGDATGWTSALPTYGELVYRELWPNIDLVFRGHGGDLKYEFHLDPGADPRDIRLDYDGARGLSVGPDGRLEIQTPLGVLYDAAPVSRQDAPDTRMAVDTRYVTGHDGAYGFAVGEYDGSRPLAIDQAIAYSTFVGGAGSEAGRGIAVDVDGNVYVTGQTASPDYPTTLGAFDRGYNNNVDVFVTKLDPSGSEVVYSTFVGGTAFDSGNGIAVDSEGAAYVGGFTGSPSYPTTPGAFDRTHNGGGDAFVTKLDSTGSALAYSTFLGGAGFSFEGANGIAVDRDGSAYVTGFTGSSAYPTTFGAFDTTHNGRNDVYVTKLDPSGASLSYSTFLGGTTSDTGNAIALDGAGEAYVTGFTASADFPVTPGAHDKTHNGANDAFVARLDGSGSSLVYSTFLGGASNDSGQGIAVDDKGKSASVAGSTDSADYPTTSRAHDSTYNGNGDAFIASLNKSAALEYSTFLGGTAADAASGIAADPKGKVAHVTGFTDSADYPATPDAGDGSHNGGRDAFLTTVKRSNGRLLFSTFLGGTGTDVGNAIAADAGKAGAYVTGSTDSGDFPTTSGVFDATYKGGGDVFITRIEPSRGHEGGEDGR